MSEEENTDKQHEPSLKKLEDARKKGEIARSADLNVAATYGGLLLVYATFGSASLVMICSEMVGFLEQAFVHRESAGLRNLTYGLSESAFLALAGWITMPAGSVLLVLFGLRGFTFAPEKIAPKLSRISVISNAKNKFGKSGLFEFGKSFLKLVIYSICLGLFLTAHLDEMAAVTSASPGNAVLLMFGICAEFLFVAFLVALSIGCVDYLFQHKEHLRKNRMSDKEMRDEQKEAEGDPHMKGSRRQRAQELSQNQLAARVPEADVIIVNPEHYAVALSWSRMPGSAPVCTAKGVDETALVIRRLAAQHGVPIQRDPPTARALYAATDVDHEIDHEHFAAVAAAIRFSDEIRRKVKNGWQ